LGISGAVFLAGCGSGTTQQLPPPNPTPAITSISPNSAIAGGGGFMLTVNGTGFVTTSTVNFGGASPATTYVSSTQLTAAVAPAAFASAGTVAVTVFNPTPGGGSSNAMNFTITVSHASGPSPSSVAIVPDPSHKFGKFAYVANGGTSDIATYTINPTTGALEPLGTVPAPASPTWVAVDPLGRFAFVASLQGLSTGSISAYKINSATGALTLAGTISGSCHPFCPVSVTVDPQGNFVYVPNGVGPVPTSVSILGINVTTGVLTSLAPTNVPGRAFSLAVHPSGKFAYVASAYPADSVNMYAVDRATGALSSIGTVDAGSTDHNLRMQIVIHPSGNFAYVVGDGCALDTYNGSVSMFNIDPSRGALTPVGSAVGAGYCADSIAIHPLGNFAYVTNEQGDTVSIYMINSATGVLTPIGVVATGARPTSIVIDPSGKFAYVTNQDSNSVSIYSIDDVNGSLTLIGTTAM
jgi:6-phosphogluconolactonase